MEKPGGDGLKFLGLKSILILCISLVIGALLFVQVLWMDSLQVVWFNNKAVDLLEESLEKRAKLAQPSPKNPWLWTSILNFFKKQPQESDIQKLPEDPHSEQKDLKMLIHRQDAQSAYQHLLEAMEKKSFDPRLYLNLGLAFELNGEWDQAFLSYEKAKKYSGDDPRIDFLSLYNGARVRGLQQKIPEALSLYQGALEIIPDSKEVKTNIELLMRLHQQQQKQQAKNNQGDSDKDKSDSQGDQENKDGPIQNRKDQPRIFKSELSEDDIRNILDEIQTQEQKIRAKEHKQSKEKPREKDW